MDRRPLTELRAVVAAGPPYDQAFLEALREDSRKAAGKLYAMCVTGLEREAREQARLESLLVFEREALDNGFTRVAGVDEAGRGPLAGPVVAAAVVLHEPVPGLNDSKQLSLEERERLYETLTTSGHAIGVSIIPPQRIDAQGIQSANYAAMMEAAARVEPRPDFLLVDGFRIPACPWPHRRIVKGDRRSLSIAAASIIAKVTRDRIMDEMDALYPGYGFARHKGYGTPEHLHALRRLGPCLIHRRSFAPIAGKLDTGLLFGTNQEG